MLWCHTNCLIIIIIIPKQQR